MTTEHKFYFFGCWKRAGHYLHEPGGRAVDYEKSPWVYKLDGRVQPGPPEKPCVGAGIPETKLTHEHGWTAFAFWDRTVDTRGRCCAAFVAQGAFTEAQMVAKAKELFPEIWARFGDDR